MKTHRISTHKNSRWGGITLEYILVTTFSLTASMLALGYIKKTVSEKIKQISHETVTDSEEISEFED